MFVYLSNESKTAVFFDNLDVTHIRGRLVEENAYYAYGLKIKGISARAFSKGSNPYGYQGDFSEGDAETGWDEFDLRMYDAQIGRWTGVDPYDEFAGPYIGMGSNPVNLIDPSGGSIGAGGWGAITGAVAFGITGYIIAKNNGQSCGSSIAWGIASSFLGAGVGYGIGSSLAGEGPFGLNTRAFYEGFFGGGDSWVNAKFDHMNRGWGYVATPNIWSGGGGVPLSEKDALSAVARVVLENIDAVLPSITRRPDPIPRDQRPSLPTSTVTTRPRAPICDCSTTQMPGQPQIRTFNWTSNSPDALSYSDSGISDEQFDVVSFFAGRLTTRLSVPGAILVNARLLHTMRFQTNASDPINGIPNTGGAYIEFNPVTGRRVDNWRPGLQMRPASGVGRTYMQHYDAQTIAMRNLLRMRFGPNITGITTPGNSSPRYRFSGHYTVPGPPIQIRTCICR